MAAVRPGHRGAARPHRAGRAVARSRRRAGDRRRFADAAKHVFTRLYGDAALAAARHADASRAAGVALPALAGLPVTVKDLYDVAGETTMAGSVVCDGEPAATRDAVAVARLRTPVRPSSARPT